MPIYEYLCEQCGSRSEVLQRMDEAPRTVCDDCGGPLRKLISAPSFQFKGSGWYVTDYAKGTEKGGAAPKDDAKSEASSEAKPVAASGDSGPGADKKSDKNSDKPSDKAADKASSSTSGSASPSSSSDS